MSSHARTPDPLGLMRVCDPVDAVALRAELAATEIEEAIARAIGRADCQGELDPPGDAFAAAPIPSRRSASRPLALAGALVALIAAVLLLTGAFSGAGSHPTYAAAAVKVAEANPRLLVTAPGWKVTDANEFEIGNGEMTFADGTRKLSLTWYPARLYRSYLRDRASVSEPRSSRLLGHAATTVDYGRGEYATMLSPFGAVFVELRGRLGGRSAYRSVLASLRPVDVDTWLGAMPPSVVAPEAQPRTVRRMLRGIPLPPNFHPIGLTGESTVLDHYSLGVKVADAVACGWVEAWLAARGSPVR